jgi:hypothetical protein
MIETLKQIIKETPNDQELGARVKQLVKELEAKQEHTDYWSNFRDQEYKEKITRLLNMATFPYVGDEFRDAVKNWFAYLVGHQKYFHNLWSVQAFLREMGKLSEERATESIYYSMANSWKMVIEIKDNGKESTSNIDEQLNAKLRAKLQGSEGI